MDRKKIVRDNYGKIAREAGSGCCGTSSESIGYDAADATAAPPESNMGLGCGNPIAIADLKPGETVLDLGSGGGFDCFLAANAVGPKGAVIGVDMTEEMICRARNNAADAGYNNVEFLLGEIEDLPLEDNSVDVVISNCVINLVPDKERAFAETVRVLKPGGRFHVADIVLNGELPPALLNSANAYVSCVAGALTKENYLSAMRESGLTEIEIEREQNATQLLKGCCQAGDDGCGCTPPSDLVDGLISSVTFSARKP